MAPRTRLTPDERRFNSIKSIDLKSGKDSGWSHFDLTDKPLQVLTEDEFESEFAIANKKAMFQHMSTSMQATLGSIGQEIKTENIFRYLISPALNIICTWTTQSLVKHGHPPMSELEFIEFIGTKHLRSRFNLSTTEAYKIMEPLAVSKNFSNNQTITPTSKHCSLNFLFPPFLVS